MLHSLIHRLLSIPVTPAAFKKEVSIINYLAHSNNLKFDVNNFIRKKRISQILDTTTTHPRNQKHKNKNNNDNNNSSKEFKYIRLPYLGNLSFQLARLLKPLKIKPGFYSINTSKKLFVRSKDPIPKMERSGVYKLKCDKCPATYIGETGRQLNIRVKEHVKNYCGKSVFGNHLQYSKHSFKNPNNIHLLHQENLKHKRLALETIEIIKHINNKNDKNKNNCKKNDSRLVNDNIPTSLLAQQVYNCT